MRFERRQLLPVLSFAFGVDLGVGEKPTRYSGPDGKTADGLSWVRQRIGDGKSDGHRRTVLGAHDPTALGRGYQQPLGISLTASSYEEPVCQQEAGPTVFSPFAETSDYFGDLHKVGMVNFRLRDLDRMAAQLRAAGIAVKIDPQSYPNGRFARLHDPEGDPIDLWQPQVPRDAPR